VNVNEFINDDFEYSEPLFCPKCYTNLKDFVSNGFLGCENCYKVFRDEIENYINTLQVSNVHIGKRCYCKNITSKEEQISTLERELRIAISEQRFEDCLEIKNKLNKLKENENE
ncbi:MAG: UvrB/UvrC motif-containing protein, partial [Clostridiales bacterium]|nr:UvrB/UvrC motif-containing protein [Candidatus Apopatousia equi]